MVKTSTKTDKTDKEDDKKEKTITSIDILSDALKEFKEEHLNYHERVRWAVSTGSLLMDAATGGVQPSLWRLAGQNNSGKTPEALEIVRNILKDVPNSKCLWVIAEGRYPSKQNAERCGLTFVTDPKEWKIGTIFVLKTNIFELFIKIVRDLIKNNDENIRYAFVVDSVDGLTLRDDAAKEITENNKVAGVPGMSKKMLQSLSLGMFDYGHWMGLISQVTAEIKLDPYTKAPNRGGQFSGGNALLHGSDVIVQYEQRYPGDFILDKDGKFNDGKTKPIGQNVRITLVKSVKEETKGISFTVPVKYGRKPCGVWIEREIGDMMLAWEMLKKAGEKGAWMNVSITAMEEVKKATGFEFPEKIQGMEKLYQILEDNKEVSDYLFKKFSKMTILE
jgi:hypothetical protein